MIQVTTKKVFSPGGNCYLYHAAAVIDGITFNFRINYNSSGFPKEDTLKRENLRGCRVGDAGSCYNYDSYHKFRKKCGDDLDKKVLMRYVDILDGVPMLFPVNAGDMAYTVERQEKITYTYSIQLH